MTVIKKICLFGPESVGKTTIARRLAAEFGTVFVPEVARDMLITNDFTPDEIIRIGYAQTEAVLTATRHAHRILFCDTDLITTQIYADIYLHQVPPVLYELEKQVYYDRYALLDIDVPWVADGLRDLGHRRAEMLARFRYELDKRGLAYTLVSGDYDARIGAVRAMANALLGSQ